MLMTPHLFPGVSFPCSGHALLLTREYPSIQLERQLIARSFREDGAWTTKKLRKVLIVGLYLCQLTEANPSNSPCHQNINVDSYSMMSSTSLWSHPRPCWIIGWGDIPWHLVTEISTDLARAYTCEPENINDMWHLIKFSASFQNFKLKVEIFKGVKPVDWL